MKAHNMSEKKLVQIHTLLILPEYMLPENNHFALNRMLPKRNLDLLH